MQHIQDFPSLLYPTADTSILSNRGHSTQDGSAISPLQTGTSHHHHWSLGLGQNLTQEDRAISTTFTILFLTHEQIRMTFCTKIACVLTKSSCTFVDQV